MTKVNPKNGTETQSYIFPQYMFKSDIISFLFKTVKVLPWFSKTKFLRFMARVNANNKKETKSGIF